MRRFLLLGLCAAPLAVQADASDLMAITNPAVDNPRPTLRVAATGFAANTGRDEASKAAINSRRIIGRCGMGMGAGRYNSRSCPQLSAGT